MDSDKSNSNEREEEVQLGDLFGIVLSQNQSQYFEILTKNIK